MALATCRVCYLFKYLNVFFAYSLTDFRLTTAPFLRKRRKISCLLAAGEYHNDWWFAGDWDSFAGGFIRTWWPSSNQQQCCNKQIAKDLFQHFLIVFVVLSDAKLHQKKTAVKSLLRCKKVKYLNITHLLFSDRQKCNNFPYILHVCIICCIDETFVAAMQCFDILIFG